MTSFCVTQFCKLISYSRILNLAKLTIYLNTDNRDAIVQRCSVKRVFLEISQNLQENTCARASFLIKLRASGTGTGVFKEALAQMFSCKFCEISKNTFFYWTPPVAASNKLCWKNQCFVSIKNQWIGNLEMRQLKFASLLANIFVKALGNVDN